MSRDINSIVIDDSDDDSDDEDKRTIFCANLSDEVTEDLLYELFLQAGPIEQVRIPKEPDGKRQKSFGFITYVHKCTVPYAIKLYEGVKLFKRTLTIRSRIPNPNNNKRNSITPNNNDRYNKTYEQQNLNFQSSSPLFSQFRENILNVNRLNKEFLENLNNNPYGGGLPLDINSFNNNNNSGNNLLKQNTSNDDRLSRHSRSSSSSRHNRNRHNDKPYNRPENYNRNNRDRHYNNRQDRNSNQRRRR